MDMFKIIGVIGLLLISAGVLLPNKKQEDICFILGGLLLEAYSAHIQDPIFMVLQVVFILAAIYDLVKQSSVSRVIE